MITFVADSHLQNSFKNFVMFFGSTGLRDLLNILHKCDYDKDQQFQKWNVVCKKNGIGYVDFELIRVYRRYVDVNSLSNEDHVIGRNAIQKMNMTELAIILEQNFKKFKENITFGLSQEAGQEVLQKTTDTIFKNIQIKLAQFLEG